MVLLVYLLLFSICKIIKYKCNLSRNNMQDNMFPNSLIKNNAKKEPHRQWNPDESV